MLREYFAVDIDEETKTLTGLPVLVEGHTPPTSRLPEFVLSLAHEVEWEEEKGCFRTVADALARFYAASDEHWDEEGDYSGADYGADQGADRVPGEWVRTRSRPPPRRRRRGTPPRRRERRGWRGTRCFRR